MPERHGDSVKSSAPHVTTGGRHRLGRHKTLSLRVMEVLNRSEHEPPLEAWEADARPVDRGECKDGPRPCVRVGCPHALYLDVNPRTGSITLNFPELEPEEMVESCALDAADLGGMTLDAVAERVNLTRERVRQVEEDALRKLKRAGGDDLGLPPERDRG